MYSGLFGALSNELRMNFIANNLANVNTTGYKRDMLAFGNTMSLYAHDIIMEPTQAIRSKKLLPDPVLLSRVQIATAQTDFSQGSMDYTGNPLDVALSGNGFFQVRTDTGDYLTRNGHFMKAADGTLVNALGQPILDAGGGEITLPEGSNISIAYDGRIFVDDAEVAQLAVIGVDDPKTLEKQGYNMYRLRQGAEDTMAQLGQGVMVSQGYLEKANVQVVTEMVNMIETQRQFEAYQKVMQTSDAVDREAINKVSKARV
jgi:flagellar basal-body rod protein FlgG